MNPITEIRQQYDIVQQAHSKMRLKIGVNPFPKYLLVYQNTLVQEKEFYTYCAYSLLESTFGTATLEQVKKFIYGDSHVNSYKPTTYENNGFFFPLDTYTFFCFQFYYQDVPYGRFNRLFRTLLYICCGCYRIGGEFYCSVEELSKQLGYLPKTIISLLDQLQSGGWILRTSTGNNYKGKPNSYKININLLNYDFFCMANRKETKYHRDLTNFCFKQEDF